VVTSPAIVDFIPNLPRLHDKPFLPVSPPSLSRSKITGTCLKAVGVHLTIEEQGLGRQNIQVLGKADDEIGEGASVMKMLLCCQPHPPNSWGLNRAGLTVKVELGDEGEGRQKGPGDSCPSPKLDCRSIPALESKVECCKLEDTLREGSQFGSLVQHQTLIRPASKGLVYEQTSSGSRLPVVSVM